MGSSVSILLITELKYIISSTLKKGKVDFYPFETYIKYINTNHAL